MFSYDLESKIQNVPFCSITLTENLAEILMKNKHLAEMLITTTE
jgi:hypothetical protein